MSSKVWILLISLAYVVQQPSFEQDVLLGSTDKHIYKGGLQEEAYLAFKQMQAAALKEEIEIQIVSGYRSYERQKQIWNGKYQRFTKQGLSPEAAIAKIIEYSTIPGTSRHHWGTDMDIIDASKTRPKSVLQTEHFEEGGVYRDLKLWMEANADAYGFCLVYTDEPKRKGFKFEPWHYSYQPIAKPMLEAYNKLDLLQILQADKIEGSTYLTPTFISTYKQENVLDINPVLK